MSRYPGIRCIIRTCTRWVYEIAMVEASIDQCQEIPHRYLHRLMFLTSKYTLPSGATDGSPRIDWKAVAGSFKNAHGDDPVRFPGDEAYHEERPSIEVWWIGAEEIEQEILEEGEEEQGEEERREEGRLTFYNREASVRRRIHPRARTEERGPSDLGRLG